MAVDDADYQQQSQKKTCSQRCDDIKRSIWNAEKREFIGRTAESWGTLFVKRFLGVMQPLCSVSLTTAEGKR